MLSIKPGSRHSSDIKLGGVGVGASVSHGKYESLIVIQVRFNLIFKLVSPDGFTSCTVALWISSLDHKAFYNSVEYKVVIVAILGVCGPVLDSLGAVLRVQFNVNLSHRSIYHSFSG